MLVTSDLRFPSVESAFRACTESPRRLARVYLGKSSHHSCQTDEFKYM